MLPMPRVYSPRATRTKPSVVEWVIQQTPASVPLSIRANQPSPAIGGMASGRHLGLLRSDHRLADFPLGAKVKL